MKDKGVSIKVSENFYRMMERTRLNLKNKYGLKVGSHVKLTEMFSKNPKLFSNRKWIKQIQKVGY